ncbi:myristoyl transferase [Yersinia similis]|uniref:ABC-type nitrate/sulfonate/taurine/bicarbonate transport systems periplasmic proteins n=2 Tax=Yersinia similis TaxID=367190 RepID=A0A0T9PJB7_9GAMM|nr:ABC transporter substrate-binding protein [Yersinia similis]AHK21311.1 myristoyl transferase [Yersinia similis]CFQ53175.1 ABC-type nitrate/sulfonate/taurine/bicarbonate transport systems periplasmic proteins [Yersinia similis]CNB55507.1 ABC-type nitrate/sulfonate/taurine/bicarbonate transport systems periplasmic proteins [Yersinia similis]CNE48452.1 ABC-type nitrate/sulfonate/taurine/bicarbonate transport systems periplasmic proteins [Yersinia similis]CNH68615.1 ABC-type nitrate/sulfonate/t
MIKFIWTPIKLFGFYTTSLKKLFITTSALPLLMSSMALAQPDIVRLANLKFAHYGAISYMKEIAPKYNIKIEERMFAKGIDIAPAIVAGQIDIAASAVDAAIAARAQSIPIYVIAGFAKGGARIVIGNNSSIKSIADLKGKKVGVARGGAQELLLLAELDKYGLTWSDRPGKDVQIIYMAYADLNQALQSGNLDAISQSEPHASQAINMGYGVELLKPYDTPVGVPIRALIMTAAMYKEKPEVAARVLKLFVDATNTFIQQPEIAEQYVRKEMFKNQITSQDYQDAIGNSPFSYDITVEHVQVTTDLMQKYGIGRMNTPPIAADWVKTDLLEAAKKSIGVDES